LSFNCKSQGALEAQCAQTKEAGELKAQVEY